jgi:hypothetical protein
MLMLIRMWILLAFVVACGNAHSQQPQMPLHEGVYRPGKG